jgi:alpha,alpha-trehalase
MRATVSGYVEDMEPFPPEPLRQYALLADGERGALVGPRGDIAFLCAPQWHDPAVFSSLIGGGGHYAVTPARTEFVWGGYYEADTLIWRSRWVTTCGIVECREALTYPADRHRLVVLREVHATEGDCVVRVVLDPRPDFGAKPVTWRSLDSGVWEGHAGGLNLRWTGAPSPSRHHHSAIDGELRLHHGQQHDLVLEISDRPLPSQAPHATHAWTRTAEAWTDDRPDFADSLAPGDVAHSYAVLRGLTSASGGMVAAATMALPERADKGRNFDYRYAWIRDQCYAGLAAAAAGGYPLLDAAADFVSGRLLADGRDLKPAYTVDGARVPDERDLDVDGYPGGTGKVGNRANQQFQRDARGEALILFAAAARADRLDDHHARAAQRAIDAIDTRWEAPDAGIWELDVDRWAHSRLICAAGLRQYAEERGGRRKADLNGFADALIADVNTNCLHPRGRWQRAPDDDRVDASLLLPALRGALPANDARSIATWKAVREELGSDGFVYRFRQQAGPLDEAEGAFVLCGFHMAMATHQQGDLVQAVRWFERNRSACGPPGLFAEEFDVIQRQLRGNLPQAFVHAMLIESAVRLAQPSPTGAESSP